LSGFKDWTRLTSARQAYLVAIYRNSGRLRFVPAQARMVRSLAAAGLIEITNPIYREDPRRGFPTASSKLTPDGFALCSKYGHNVRTRKDASA